MDQCGTLNCPLCPDDNRCCCYMSNNHSQTIMLYYQIPFDADLRNSQEALDVETVEGRILRSCIEIAEFDREFYQNEEDL